MWILKAIVGSPILKGVVVALGAGSIILGAIQYIRWAERDRIIKQIQIEDLKNEKELREKLDEINRSPFDDVNDALEFLRGRVSGEG